MADPRIVTNNVPRLVIDACELSATEQEEFDYLDWDAIKAGEDSATFVRYRGELHDLGEFEVISSCGSIMVRLAPWDGWRPDTFFSAMLVRYCDDDHVVVGHYYSS